MRNFSNLLYPLNFLILFFTVTLFLFTPEVFSQETIETKNSADTAKTLFEEAEAYYSVQEFEKALEKYQVSYSLSKEPYLLFNMAQCYRFLARHEEAIISYQSFLRELPDTPLRKEVEALIATSQLQAEKQAQQIPASAPVISEKKPLPTSLPMDPKKSKMTAPKAPEPGEKKTTFSQEPTPDKKAQNKKILSEKPPRQKYFTIASYTEAPISVGISAEWTPTRWISPTVSIGFLPKPYSDLINLYFLETGQISVEESGFLQQMTNNAPILSASLRTYPWKGFYLEGGASLALLRDADIPTTPIIASLRAQNRENLALALENSDQQFVGVQSSASLIRLGAGWRFNMNAWQISIGAAFVLPGASEAQTDLAADEIISQDAVDTVNNVTNQFFKERIFDKVYTPTLTLSFGPRF